MENLIKIHEWKSGRVVSARELHKFLDSKQQFADWIKNKISSYGFVENEDYTVFHNSMKNLQGGRPQKEYALTMDTAKELAMIENNIKGRQARKYFIAMEEIVRQRQVSLPTRKELAEMVIKEAERAELAESIIEKQRPLVNYAETVQKADDTILLRQLAKHICNSGKIQVGQNRLFEWMRVNGYLNKKNEPYQKYVDQGLFGYHETQVGNPGRLFTRRTTTVTGKGRVYFVNKYLMEHGVKRLAL